MRTDRIQLGGDLGVGVAEADHPQHLDLALGQAVGRSRRRLGGDPRSKPWVQVRVAPGGPAHRFDELCLGRVLEDVAERAGAERLARVRRLVLHRQHDDLGVRGFGPDRRDVLEARSIRQVEVQDEHLRVVAANEAPCVVDVAGLGQNLQVGLCSQHLLEAATHDRVVVGDHYPDHAVRVATRPRCSRNGARYFASILPTADQLGVSLISELDPCPPVMCALRYFGLSRLISTARMIGMKRLRLHGRPGERCDRARGGVALLGRDPAVLDGEVGRVAGGPDALEAADLAVRVDRNEATR